MAAVRVRCPHPHPRPRPRPHFRRRRLPGPHFHPHLHRCPPVHPTRLPHPRSSLRPSRCLCPRPRLRGNGRRQPWHRQRPVKRWGSTPKANSPRKKRREKGGRWRRARACTRLIQVCGYVSSGWGLSPPLLFLPQYPPPPLIGCISTSWRSLTNERPPSLTPKQVVPPPARRGRKRLILLHPRPNPRPRLHLRLPQRPVTATRVGCAVSETPRGPRLPSRAPRRLDLRLAPAPPHRPRCRLRHSTSAHSPPPPPPPPPSLALLPLAPTPLTPPLPPLLLPPPPSLTSVALPPCQMN